MFFCPLGLQLCPRKWLQILKKSVWVALYIGCRNTPGAPKSRWPGKSWTDVSCMYAFAKDFWFLLFLDDSDQTRELLCFLEKPARQSIEKVVVITLSDAFFDSGCLMKLDMCRIRPLLINMKILQLNMRGRHNVLCAANDLCSLTYCSSHAKKELIRNAPFSIGRSFRRPTCRFGHQDPAIYWLLRSFELLVARR